MPDQNREEQVFREEYVRESARIKVREDLKQMESGKQKAALPERLRPYLLPGCLLASLAALIHYLGGIVGINWRSVVDWQFAAILSILAVLGALFYFKS